MLYSYLRPIERALDAFPWASIVALVLTTLDLAWGLIQTRAELVVLLVLLVSIDFISGIWRSWIHDEEIKSRIMRRTVVKVLEYMVVLSVAIMVTRAFEFEGVPRAISIIVGQLDIWCFLFVALIEARSVLENITGKRASKVSKWVLKRIDDQTSKADLD